MAGFYNSTFYREFQEFLLINTKVIEIFITRINELGFYLPSLLNWSYGSEHYYKNSLRSSLTDGNNNLLDLAH